MCFPIQVFFKILGRLVGFGSQVKYIQKHSNSTEPIADFSVILAANSESMDYCFEEMENGQEQWDEKRQWISQGPPTDRVACVTMQHAAQQTDNIEWARKYCDVIRQWALVTNILDRCFALLFCVLNVLALVVLFPRPSSLYLQRT